MKGHEGHILKNQGHAVWDFMDEIDEGIQYFCENCQATFLVVDSKRKVDVDPALLKRTMKAFEKMGPM